MASHSAPSYKVLEVCERVFSIPTATCSRAFQCSVSFMQKGQLLQGFSGPIRGHPTPLRSGVLGFQAGQK